MRSALLLVLTVLAAPACAEAERGALPREGRDYRVDITEDLSAERFDLRLISLSGRELCLEIDTWPREGGLTEAWQGTVFVQTELGRLPMHGRIEPTRDAAYWNVARGEEVDGYIPFDAFPAGVSASRSRTLEYQAGVKFCDELSQ